MHHFPLPLTFPQLWDIGAGLWHLCTPVAGAAGAATEHCVWAESLGVPAVHPDLFRYQVFPLGLGGILLQLGTPSRHEAGLSLPPWVTAVLYSCPLRA